MGEPGPTNRVDRRFDSANDRFKATWDERFAQSTIFAVAAHAAIFALWPVLTTDTLEIEAGSFQANRLIALVDATEPTSQLGDPLAPVPVIVEEDESDTAPPGREDGDEDGLTGDGEGDLWAALGERLAMRGDLAPQIVELEEDSVATEETGSGGEDETGTSTERPDADAQLSGLSELPEADVDFDRLSALRPELAYQVPSAWVLIRNPEEVETFLRRGYREGPLDPEVSGSVSVTLWINRRGAVEWAEVTESSGREDLDDYALTVFNEVADFRAAREEGVTVSRSVTLSLNFPW